MVKVRRERPSQRLHHRVSAPLRVDLPDGEYKAVDWSLGGFGIEGYKPSARLGDTLPVTVHIPFQGFDISFPCIGEIVRCSGTGELGLSYIDLGEREHEIMSHFVDDLVRGSMTSSGDVIMRIDSPVTPVSTEPDPNPGDQIPVHRRSLKVITITLLYFFVGIATASYTGLVLYSNFWRLEVDTAVVSAPVQPLLASADGHISHISVAQNKEVSLQTPMIEISDAVLRHAIELAEIQVNRATMEFIASQKELAGEQKKFQDYRIIALNQLAKTNARIRSLEKQVILAKNQLSRFQKLEGKGWTTKSKLDEVASAHAELSGELEQTRLLKKERLGQLSSIKQGHFFTGNILDGRIKELSAVVDLKWEGVQFSKDELLALERRRERLVLSSPSRGRVIKFLKPVGTTVKRGEQVALFERDEARTIDAFLTQEEILEIGLGDEAVVFFPSLDQKVNAVVLEIDRTTAYVDEMDSQYEWRGPKDRSARVSLGFLDISEHVVRRRFAPGLPAVVIFERRNTNEITSLFSQLASRSLSPGKSVSLLIPAAR